LPKNRQNQNSNILLKANIEIYLLQSNNFTAVLRFRNADRINLHSLSWLFFHLRK
jgi:hypothetical protein